MALKVSEENNKVIIKCSYGNILQTHMSRLVKRFKTEALSELVSFP